MEWRFFCECTVLQHKGSYVASDMYVGLMEPDIYQLKCQISTSLSLIIKSPGVETVSETSEFRSVLIRLIAHEVRMT
jgi:hypothetical protein